MKAFNEHIDHYDWGREPRELYAPIEYMLRNGGKRLRPYLALLGCELLGGAAQEAFPVALAVEFFHNFTLMHDDLMDNASVRHNKPTVHVKWNASTAILSGDQLIIEAYKCLEKVKESQSRKIFQLFNAMATAVCEGQQYDMNFECRQDVSLAEYLQMIRLKTAELLATALQMGVYIGGGDAQKQRISYELGIAMGMIFQIKDDYLDTYGSEETFGKAIGGDICENKKTILLILAQQKGVRKAELNEWLSANDFDREEKIAAVKSIYEANNVEQQTNELIAEYQRTAMEHLNALPQNTKREELKNLLNHLINREI